MSDCNYRTRADGTLFVPNLYPEKVEALYQIKKDCIHLLNSGEMDSIVSMIEEELFKDFGRSFKTWLSANKKEITSKVKSVCNVEMDDDCVEVDIKSRINVCFRMIFE